MLDECFTLRSPARWRISPCAAVRPIIRSDNSSFKTPHRKEIIMSPFRKIPYRHNSSIFPERRSYSYHRNNRYPYKDLDMQKIITSLSRKHGIPGTEIMANIETFLSSMLSQWYRMEVMVFFRDDFLLEAIAYDRMGGIIMQKPVDLLKFKDRNALNRPLEMIFAKASVFKQTARYKPFEGALLWGEISACDADRNLYIDTEIIQGEQLTAICPINRIGLHERRNSNCSLGRKRAFHLRQVEPVMLNGTPRLKVTVDRVSKTLVETLLKNRLKDGGGKTTLRCVKRYVGHKSIVLTTRPLPKEAIIAVDRELKERVQVKVVKSLAGLY